MSAAKSSQRYESSKLNLGIGAYRQKSHSGEQLYSAHYSLHAVSAHSQAVPRARYHAADRSRGPDRAERYHHLISALVVGRICSCRSG
jgi:hypothetical protein